MKHIRKNLLKKGNFKASFLPELITDFTGVNQFSKDTKTLILDARSEARFNCLVDEPRQGLRRGTIPNPPKTYHTQNYLMLIF